MGAGRLPTVIDHDPKLGIKALKGMKVYVSAGSGRDDFGQPGSVAKHPANAAGIGLEVISRMTTQTFVDFARRDGVEVTSVFRPSGVHDWPYWQFEMGKAWPHIAGAPQPVAIRPRCRLHPRWGHRRSHQGRPSLATA